MKPETKLIQLETAPVINSEGMVSIGDLLDKRITAMNIDGQIATIESVKSLKEMKSSLNKDFKIYEEQRKTVKDAISAPYLTFDAEYKVQISAKFKDATDKLTEKIASVENALKKDKTEKLKTFFDESCAALSIDFLKFDSVGLNVTLSATEKSLKASISTYTSNVSANLLVIDTLENDQDFKDDVLIDYKTTLDLGVSLANVKKRRDDKRKIAEANDEKERIAKLKPEPTPPVEKEKEFLSAPVVVNDEEFTSDFSVTASLSKLKMVKEFLEANNIAYKTI